MINNARISIAVLLVLVLLSVASADNWYVSNLWHFDVDSELKDSGPAKNNLTVIGLPEYIPGYLREGIGLDATSSSQSGFVAGGSMLDLNTDGIKIDLMIRPDSDHQGNRYNNTIVNRGGHFNLYFITDQSGVPTRLRWEVRGPSQVTFVDFRDSISGILDGQWHHVVATYDPFSSTDPNSSFIELQIDEGDVLTNTHKGTVGTQANPVIFIGSATAGMSGSGFSGDIDELSLSIWTEELELTMQTTPEGKGNTVPQTGITEFAKDSLVQISASPYIECPDIYVFDYWQGDVIDIDLPDTLVYMDQAKTVTAIYTLAQPECGDQCHSYPEGDFDEDCEVTLSDLKEFTSVWLDCTLPSCD